MRRRLGRNQDLAEALVAVGIVMGWVGGLGAIGVGWLSIGIGGIVAVVIGLVGISYDPRR